MTTKHVLEINIKLGDGEELTIMREVGVPDGHGLTDKGLARLAAHELGHWLAANADPQPLTRSRECVHGHKCGHSCGFHEDNGECTRCTEEGAADSIENVRGTVAYLEASWRNRDPEDVSAELRRIAERLGDLQEHA